MERPTGGAGGGGEEVQGVWSVGPWTVEPRGLALCGNRPEDPKKGILELLGGLPDPEKGSAADAEKPAAFASRKYVERLSQQVDMQRPIDRHEIERLLGFLARGEEGWETVQRDSRQHVRKHVDSGLLKGAVLVRLEAAVEGASLPHVLNCFVNFRDREQWDQQIEGFRLLGNVATNDLVHYKLHAPPLTDRDFLAFHTLLRHADGKKVLLYQRAAADALLPPTRVAVRAVQYCHAVILEEVAATAGRPGGVKFTVTTAVNPQIPFLPKWVMNLLTPSEFRKWVTAVEKRSKELKQERSVTPCDALFRLPEVASPAAAPLGQEVESPYGEVDQPLKKVVDEEEEEVLWPIRKKAGGGAEEASEEPPPPRRAAAAAPQLPWPFSACCS